MWCGEENEFNCVGFEVSVGFPYCGYQVWRQGPRDTSIKKVVKERRSHKGGCK